MAVVGAVVAVVGLGVSVAATQSQAREAKIQKTATTAVEFSKRARERRAALKERRIRTAQLSVSAEATGVAGSSGELGTEAALSTNFATNVGFGAGLQETRNVIGASQVRSARAGVRGAVGGAVQGVGTSIFNANGGFNRLFETSQPTFNPATRQPSGFIQ